MREFVVSENAIEDEAAIDIAAAPEDVARLYRDVDRWGEIFPATITRAKVVQTGDNWKEIAVAHRQEGDVPNTLIDLSETEIGLHESKHKFDASFLNRFEPSTDGGTHYVVHTYISLKGVYRLLKPFLIDYVHRQSQQRMRRYVLEPLKIVAERECPNRKRNKTGREA